MKCNVLIILIILTIIGNGRKSYGDSFHTSSVRVNDIQVIGTHNSYHTGLSPGMKELLDKTHPKFAKALSYSHPPLEKQLEDGIRLIELDIYADTKGGRYQRTRATEWVKSAGITSDAQDGNLDFSGTDFKVFHIIDIDQNSSCDHLMKCLNIIRKWSDSHPDHLPLFILLETKQTASTGGLSRSTQPEEFTPATYDMLDSELVRAIGRQNIIAPDDVREGAPSLRSAVQSKGWPTLERARGKIIFLFDRPHDTARYEIGHKNLEGRVIFPNASVNGEDSAFIEVNSPDVHVISELVKAGYLVRTRADTGGSENPPERTRMRDDAVTSGAQLISTDYPPEERFSHDGYLVQFPGLKTVRCAPLRQASGCSAEDLLEDRTSVK